MALNLSYVKNRLNSLSNTKSKSNLVWKPTGGKQTIRIVPYKFNTEIPFIELKFHYNLNGKTYLSPDSFNRPDPIVEFSNKLKKSGSKDEWQFGRKIEPKARTYVPIIVRGEEALGVRFWGFGKSVFQEIMSVMADPDYGDITDLANGRDILVEFKSAVETGKQFPETSIRVKPNTSPAVDPKNKDLVDKLSNQTNILELFPEPTYDELKAAMEAWLNAEEEVQPTSESSDSSQAETTPATEPATKVAPPAAKVKSPSTESAKSNTDDVAAAFDNLFNS